MTTKAVATVLGGFWDVNGATPLSSMSGKGSGRRRVAQILAEASLIPIRAVMTALDGVAPGAAALKTVSRITADPELGGVRVVENVNVMNRVTTAADVTEIEADFHTFHTRTYTTSPVANGDLNPLGTR